MTMSRWNDGYAIDSEYTVDFIPDLTPQRLNYACWLHGVEPVDLDRPFTYFELGCGHGYTSTVMAAAHPRGKFYANDFMPSHIANAQRLVDMAGLTNLHLLENSFEELALGQVDLPTFDFITLHGVYAWVSLEQQAHIVTFLDRYLKPGGVVYVSYNLLPGWAAAVDMQRLMVESTRLRPAADSKTKLACAKELVNQMVEAGSAFFSAHSNLQFFIDKLNTADPAYLIHEFMHEKPCPKYHADVVEEFSRAKLDYLACVSPGPSLPAEQQAVIDAVPDLVLRRTVEDFMRNTKFRKDIFVRGRRPVLSPHQADQFDKFALALCVPRETASLTLTQAWIQGLLGLLAQAPQSFSQLAQLPGIDGASNLILSIAEIIQRSEQGAVFMPCTTSPEHGPAQRLNAVIARLSCHTDQYQTLASPVVGTGIATTLMERLVYLQLLERPEETEATVVGEQVWDILRRNHSTPDKPAPDLAQVVSRVQSILTHSWPLWLQLGVI